MSDKSTFTIIGTTEDNTSCNAPNGSIDITVLPSGVYEYNWSNGGNTEDIFNLSEGSYSVTVSDPGNCIESQIFIILVMSDPPMVEFSMIPNECNNTSSIKIHPVSNEQLFYSIDGGLIYYTDTIFESLTPGRYQIMIKDVDGCTTSTTITLDEIPQYKITSDSIINVKQNESKLLEINISNLDLSKIDTIIWTPNTGLAFESSSISNLLKPNFTGTANIKYQIILYLKDGCEIPLNIRITYVDSVQIIAPNIIRNVLEEQNSNFTLYSINGEIQEIFNLKIYDRWGNLMFENSHFQPNIPIFGWNGYFNGTQVNPGVFVWIALIEHLNGEIKIYKGDLTVVR